MKTVLKAGIVLVFAIVSMFVILNADDSDAEIFVQEKNVIINGLYYDLCTNDANHSDYGSYGDHIAFVSGGSGSPNSKYAESELVIPSAVEHSGVTYKVVGLRNNAFQANMGGEPWPLLNLTKVTFPETIVAIGVDNKYNPSTTGSCFSKCFCFGTHRKICLIDLFQKLFLFLFRKLIKKSQDMLLAVFLKLFSRLFKCHRSPFG